MTATVARTAATDDALAKAGVATYAFALADGFSMMSLSAAIEPLRAANRHVGREAFRWRLYGLGGRPVSASSGIEIAVDGPLDRIGDADCLFVCTGMVPEPDPSRSWHAAMRSANRRGIALGALSTGAFLLARAGLLDGYRCTIHWEALPAFQAAFPGIACTQSVYEIDRNRYTCSGGVAAMDMMLHIVAGRLGTAAAAAVANQLHLARIRSPDDDQRTGALENLDSRPAALARAVTLMRENLDSPLPVSAIAIRTGVSVRQLERLFIRHLHWSPARFYIRLRLERARELLLHGNMPILDVALAAGFTSGSYFAEVYRAVYGYNPSETRRDDPPAGGR